jgi:hypothetical protein
MGAAAQFMRCEVYHNDSNGITIQNSGVVEVDSSFIHDNGGTGVWVSTTGEYFRIHSSTFFGNRRGMFCDWNLTRDELVGRSTEFPDTAEMYGNIFAFNDSLGVEASLPAENQRVACNNSFGNPYGDWIGSDYGAGDAYGNISEDPQFCDTLQGHFGLEDTSPCAPANNSCAALMGAFDVGCDCCLNRGDVNHAEGPSGSINVSDLSYLVDYLFRAGSPPPCEEESDVNAEGGVNVSDLAYLIDFLFRGGPPPPPC